MPGNDGEDSDAVGVYKQVVMEHMFKQGVTSSYVETWISLPIHKRPASWSQFKDPVCILRLNLYGHPLAGLVWEKQSSRHLRSRICQNQRVGMPLRSQGEETVFI